MTDTDECPKCWECSANLCEVCCKCGRDIRFPNMKSAPGKEGLSPEQPVNAKSACAEEEEKAPTPDVLIDTLYNIDGNVYQVTRVSIDTANGYPPRIFLELKG